MEESEMNNLSSSSSSLSANSSSSSKQTHSTSSNKRKCFEGKCEVSSEDSDGDKESKPPSMTRTGNGDGKAKTAEELLFSNDLLLSIIFQFSTFQDLKSFRQVNRLWKLEATKSLRKHFLTRRLGISNQTVIFPNIYGDTITSLNLQDFSEFVSASVLFPCTAFEFEDPIENIMEGEYATLFKAHGHIVKKLITSFKTITESNLLPIESFLSEHLPNLEILTAENGPKVPFTEATESALSTAIKLRSLKTVIFLFDITMPLVKRFLKIAPNLKSIFWDCLDEYDFDFDHMKSIMDFNALPILKTGILTFKNHSVEILQQVLQHNPAFEEITLLSVNEPLTPKNFKMTAEILTEMLHRCRNTIRSFSTFMPVGHVEGLKVPVFQNVNYLRVLFYQSCYCVPSMTVSLLPTGVDFSTTFPNLKVFEFQFGESEKMVGVEMIISETSMPLLSVTEIIIFGDDKNTIRMSWMERFCTLFPNVKKASFTTVKDSHFELIYALPFIEELEVGYPVNVQKDSFPIVDSVFTGFSGTTVKELYNRAPDDTIFSDLDYNVSALYVKSSIANLEKLKKLTIKFVDERFVDVGVSHIRKKYRSIVTDSEGVSRDVFKVNGNVIMSHVLKKFLFAMFPKLQSNVEVRFNNEGELMTF